MDRKEIPIIMTCNYARPILSDQSLNSIRNNTEYPNRIIYTEDYEVGPDKLTYLKLRNELANGIDFDYDYIVFIDDDIYCRKGWLKAMVEAYRSNPDVWVLAGTTWPTHRIVEVRKDISISKQFGGGCLIMSKDKWKTLKPWVINKKKTIVLWEKVFNYGGKIAVLNDQTKMIHCGAKSIINRRGRRFDTMKRIRDFAHKFGLKTN